MLSLGKNAVNPIGRGGKLGQYFHQLTRSDVIFYLPGAAPSDAHVRQAPTMQNLAIGAV